MSAVDRAIEKAGGVTKLAKGLGDIHYTSIIGWKKSGVIPSRRLIAVSRLTGIPVEELVDGSASAPTPAPEAAA